MILLVYIIGMFFIGPSHSYSILIPENMELYTIDTLNDNSINFVFIGKDSLHKFEYSFSISVINYEYDMSLENSIQIYESKCNCRVVESSFVVLNHFKGYRYIIEKEKGNISLYGTVYFSEEINSKSVNIVSMAITDDFQKIIKVSESILNTMVLNPYSELFIQNTLENE